MKQADDFLLKQLRLKSNTGKGKESLVPDINAMKKDPKLRLITIICMASIIKKHKRKIVKTNLFSLGYTTVYFIQ